MNTSFSTLPRNVKFQAYAEHWPYPWRENRTLTAAESAKLDRDLAHFAERYYFELKPLAQRCAILADLRAAVRK